MFFLVYWVMKLLKRNMKVFSGGSALKLTQRGVPREGPPWEAGPRHAFPACLKPKTTFSGGFLPKNPKSTYLDLIDRTNS